MGKIDQSDPVLSGLCRRLGAARTRRGWSLEELSRRTSRPPLSPAEVKGLESGQACDREPLERLMDALNPPPRARTSLLDAWRPQTADSERGERLARWRRGARTAPGVEELSVEALAERTGSPIALTTIRKIEEGRAVPSRRLMARLIDALGLEGHLRQALEAWADLGIREVSRAISATSALSRALEELEILDDEHSDIAWRDYVRQKRLPALDNLPVLSRSPALTERVRGALWGLFIGDALAWPHVEDSSHTQEFVTGYGPSGGSLSVDGLLNLRSLTYVTDAETFHPDGLMQVLTESNVPRLGPSQARAFINYRVHGDWRTSGVRSASIGGVSRVFPVILPHLVGESSPGAMWEDVAASTALTHDDDATVSAAAAVAALFIEALSRTGPDVDSEARWVETFRSVVAKFPPRLLTPAQGSELRRILLDPSSGSPSRLSLSEICEDLKQVLDSSWGVERLIARYNAGYYLLESIPTLLALLERLGDSPDEALLAAVNLTLGRDSLACLIGGLMGARHGMVAFRQSWLDELSDDVGPLIDRAVTRFVGEE
jgi:ADP-ribosylglycohydrolase/transcriptional regulator with XRE-family HTH domain